MAIIHALRDAINLDATEFRIFSDSMSVLKAISSGKAYNKKSHITLIIQNLCLTLELSGKSIQVYWIPAHKGITINEEAKDAVKNGIDSDILLPYSDFKAIWKSVIYDFNLFLLNSAQKKGKKYFSHFYSLGRKPWFHRSTLSRRNIVSINRIRASRTSLAYDLFRINVVDSPECSCHQSDQTINHIFWQCSLFDQERYTLINSLKKLKQFGPYCIEQFLNPLPNDFIYPITTFISSIKLNI